MEVRLISQISGTRNGAEWPKPGEVVDLPEAEAKDLVAAGHATDDLGDQGEGEARAAEPWESVGPAHGDYPDHTNRTGPPLVDQLGEVTPEGITVNADHLSDEAKAEVGIAPEAPKVPEDARVTPPTVTSETVETPAGVGTETTSQETPAAKSKK